MPNHIKNKLELIGSFESVDALIKRFSTHHSAKVALTHNEAIILRSKHDEFNFMWFDPRSGLSRNRAGEIFTGIPEGYTIDVDPSFVRFPDFEKVVPPPNHPSYKDLPNQDVARTSPYWWHTWNTENWGTKWNSYSCNSEAINIYTFETAWASVPDIIEKMSFTFPEVTIKYSWSDEDTSYNCGRAVYRNGLIEMDTPKGGTKEAYDLAFELHPHRKENYELIDGNYQYKDEE